MITLIEIQNLRLQSYHGALPQEHIVGNSYRIDATLETDFQKAMESDELTDTVNYAEVVEAIRDEMNHPSSLLEHVAGRIIRRLHKDFPPILKIDLCIAKMAPPIEADIEACAVHVKE